MYLFSFLSFFLSFLFVSCCFRSSTPRPESTCTLGDRKAWIELAREIHDEFLTYSIWPGLYHVSVLCLMTHNAGNCTGECVHVASALSPRPQEMARWACVPSLMTLTCRNCTRWVCVLPNDLDPRKLHQVFVCPAQWHWPQENAVCECVPCPMTLTPGNCTRWVCLAPKNCTRWICALATPIFPISENCSGWEPGGTQMLLPLDLDLRKLHQGVCALTHDPDFSKLHQGVCALPHDPDFKKKDCTRWVCALTHDPDFRKLHQVSVCPAPWSRLQKTAQGVCHVSDSLRLYQVRT